MAGFKSSLSVTLSSCGSNPRLSFSHPLTPAFYERDHNFLCAKGAVNLKEQEIGLKMMGIPDDSLMRMG
jgi:hypothetical protein